MPVVSPKPYRQMQAEFYAECRRLAEAAFTGYCRDLYTPLYIVGRKAKGLDTHSPHADIWAELNVAAEAPEGWSIVHPEPLSRAQAIDHATATVQSKLNREPLWIFAD